MASAVPYPYLTGSAFDKMARFLRAALDKLDATEWDEFMQMLVSENLGKTSIADRFIF